MIQAEILTYYYTTKYNLNIKIACVAGEICKRAIFGGRARIFLFATPEEILERPSQDYSQVLSDSKAFLMLHSAIFILQICT